MSRRLQRLRSRWLTARRFAAAGSSWRDRFALFRAGLARHRPFAGGSLYARIGRIPGVEITPRLNGAGGHRLALSLLDATDLIVFEEIFLDGIYPLEEVPFTPDTVVDCGACAGFFTILAHGRHPSARLHVFEPHPANLARLRRNLELNAITATVHAAAVGHQAGSARFTGEGFGGHLASATEPGPLVVGIVALPDFLRQFQPERLLLKMDIEGAEAALLPVLEPALPRVTALFLETHQPEPAWRGCLQPLLSAGFRHREIRRRHDPLAQTDFTEHLLVRP
ncbi:MAG: FkbM family methyltransferase [Verrucomicrobiota bacterium]